MTDHVAEKEDWNSSTLKEIRKLWVPVSEYILDYQFRSDPSESDIPGLFEIALKISGMELNKEFGENIKDHRLYWHEMGVAFAGLMDSTNLWLDLNSQNNCSFLPHPLEHLVLQELFKTATKKNRLIYFQR
ncbi:MAG: hypothetical protein HXS46_18205 [Theionarchaea archaeon]|nr:hypothetical protein [Theionarchaea archaeon]